MMPIDERGPDLLAQVEAVGLGQHQVEQRDVGLAPLEQLDGVVARGRHHDLEAAHEQVRAEQVDDVAVVLDDEDAGGVTAGHGRPGRPAAGGGSIGRVDPHAGAATASAPRRSSPPWASTMPRQIARPSPAPGHAGVAAHVGLEDPSRPAPAGSPGPSSCTRMVDRAVAGRRGDADRAASPPWRTALSSRFTKTCSRRSWSPQTSGTSAPTSTVHRAPRAPATQPTAASMTRPRSHQCGSSRRPPPRSSTSRACRRPAGPSGPTRPR